MPQHLLRVACPVGELERLIAAARQAGRRVGWLELPAEEKEAPGPLPRSLSTAADAGAMRAVSISGGRSVAVKPMLGAPVLRDVLREHYRGCHLVLVAGEIEAPLLAPDGEDWTITTGGAAAARWTTQALIEALLKHHPWSRTGAS